MKQVLVVGTNDLACYYAKVMHHYANMKIIAMTKKDPSHLEAFWKHVVIYADASSVQWEQIDYIFWCEKEESLSQTLSSLKQRPIILTRTQLQYLQPFVERFIQQFRNMELILNSMRDGLIVVNRDGEVRFLNDTAKDILQVPHDTDWEQSITKLIKDSRLPKVLQHQEKEVNQPLTLDNGRQIISTRMPLINENQHLIGAFAIFKDSNEVLRLAEENTDLKEIKKMLEAIIHASDEPISVVDEQGNGLMVNPAYSELTGLSEQEVLGKPATVDIYEGDSMHMQVLKTRREVRNARMKVGPLKTEVTVNASPIIVQGKIKGSVAVIHDLSEVKTLNHALKQSKQIIRNLEHTFTFQDIIGKSSPMMIAVEQARIGSRTSTTVLLRGEEGTGKELFAKAIHHESDRKYHKFIHVNCALYNEIDLDELLFGAGEKNTINGKQSVFEKANHGTIFLDHIAALTPFLQKKLLHVLQKGEVKRTNGQETFAIDIRIITATHVHLEKAITANEFREDLYYWLNRLPIFVPSLKERTEDLPSLVTHFIQKVNQLYGRSVSHTSDAAMRALCQHTWQGNVRELENVIRNTIMFMKVTEIIIEKKHLPNLYCAKESETIDLQKDLTLQQATEAFERTFILQVYQANDYNKTKTAEALNISVRNLYYKLGKYEA